MKLNAAGLDVSGEKNPRWNGGPISKTCAICGAGFYVKRANSKAKFCSMKCVGTSQRGQPKVKRSLAFKKCEVCGAEYSIFGSHADRYHCCSRGCSYKRRALVTAGSKNPNWNGGLSRNSYPWDFRATSRRIIARDGFRCMNPNCRGQDPRLTTHHINYDKQDCRDENLIALCSSCNSKANFGRDEWARFYAAMMSARNGMQRNATECTVACNTRNER